MSSLIFMERRYLCTGFSPSRLAFLSEPGLRVMNMKLAVFLTDFGLKDHYVGVMKGVLLGMVPEAQCIDLSHEIPPQDVGEGAYLLGVSYRYFPRGTVFVAVVDPGVGTGRRGLLVEAADRFFVGPDNGLFTLVYQQEPDFEAYLLANKRFFREEVSHTFHGRDIFAPVAAHLLKGVLPKDFGPRVEDPLRLPWPEPLPKAAEVKGVIIHVDRFGNLVSNISAEILKGRRIREVIFKGQSLPFKRTYAEVAPGEPLALIGSDGFLEIAVSRGSAVARFGREGEVCVRWG